MTTTQRKLAKRHVLRPHEVRLGDQQAALTALAATAVESSTIQLAASMNLVLVVLKSDVVKEEELIIKGIVKDYVTVQGATRKALEHTAKLWKSALVGKSIAGRFDETLRLFREVMDRQQAMDEHLRRFVETPHASPSPIFAELFPPLHDSMARRSVTREQGDSTRLSRGTDDGLQRARQRGAEYRAELLKSGEMLSSSDAARKLDVTTEALRKKVRNAELFALRWGSRKVYYPAWQFETNVFGEPLKRALEPIKGEDPWSIYYFFTTADPRLGDATPLEVLRTESPRRAEAVEKAAQAFAERD
jgi:hypothetical protein